MYVRTRVNREKNYMTFHFEIQKNDNARGLNQRTILILQNYAENEKKPLKSNFVTCAILVSYSRILLGYFRQKLATIYRYFHG